MDPKLNTVWILLNPAIFIYIAPIHSICYLKVLLKKDHTLCSLLFIKTQYQDTLGLNLFLYQIQFYPILIHHEQSTLHHLAKKKKKKNFSLSFDS